jgi:hypothetical protein
MFRPELSRQPYSHELTLAERLLEPFLGFF